MSEATIDVNGTELPAEDFIDAYKEAMAVEDNDVLEDVVGYANGVIVAGDRDADMYGCVYYGGEKLGDSYLSLSSFYEDAQNAVSPNVPHIRFECCEGEYGAELPLDSEYEIKEHGGEERYEIRFNSGDDVGELKGWATGRDGLNRGAHVSSIEIIEP